MTKLIDSNADTSYSNANVHCLLGLYYSCYLMEWSDLQAVLS